MGAASRRYAFRTRRTAACMAGARRAITARCRSAGKSTRGARLSCSAAGGADMSCMAVSLGARYMTALPIAGKRPANLRTGSGRCALRAAVRARCLSCAGSVMALMHRLRKARGVDALGKPGIDFKFILPMSG